MPPTLIPAHSPPREEWPDDEFDIPEGQSIIQHIDSLDDNRHLASRRASISSSVSNSSLSHQPSRPTTLRTSTGPQDQEDEFEEDWDVELQVGADTASTMASLVPTPLAVTPTTTSMPISSQVTPTGFVGTINRLGAPLSSKNPVVEDWDEDMDFGGTPSSSAGSNTPRPMIPVARPPSSAELTNWDGSDDDDDDNGNASTIKVSQLPSIQFKQSPSSAPSSSNLGTVTDDNEDMEDAFELPSDLSRLSLRPLAHRMSNNTIEWHSSDTASFTSDAPSSFGFNKTASSESPNSIPGSVFTTDEEDEDEEHDVEGLVLPDTFLPNDLKRILADKKKGQAQKAAAVPRPSKVTSPNPDDDFEDGLVFDNEALSPSRLRKPRTKSISSRIPAPSVRPPSRIIITRASTLPSVPAAVSTSKAPYPHPEPRSPSPVFQRRSIDSIRPGAVSPTRPRLRPTSGPSSAGVRSKPYLTHSSSMLTLPRTKTSSSSASHPPVVKYQKSHGRLLLSPTFTSTDDGKSPSPPRRGLTRKASLPSLADAGHASSSTDARSLKRTSGSGTSRTAATVSRGTISHAGYKSQTASSQAKRLRTTESGVVGSDRNPYHVPPFTQPTTPSEYAGSTLSSTTSSSSIPASRLTMPTSSSRAKVRPPISSIFPTSASPGLAPPSRSAGAVPPFPYHRQGSVSPVPGARASGALSPTSMQQSLRSPIGSLMARSESSSSTASHSASAALGTKIVRRPKTTRAYGDGTELDAIADLSVEREKEKKFRVVPKPVSAPSATSRRPEERDNKGTRSRKMATTITTMIPASAGLSVKRPPSSLSMRESESAPPSSGGLLRRKSRIDFSSGSLNTITAPILGPAPSPSLYAASRRKRSTAAAQKKPTLIRNLSGVGSSKVVGEMKWNPTTLRWEGNDSVLKDFDHISSVRPALITQLTGSSVGGVASPTGFLATGARIVGNMIFDPSRMCWINRFADDEVDPFADIDADEDEDKDATWGKHRGSTIRAPPPSSGTPLETVTASPARSSVYRVSTHRQSASESEGESIDTSSAIHSSPSRASIHTRGASSSPIPGIDDAMMLACQEAEERHKLEMKGWVPRNRRRRSANAMYFNDDYEEPDRSYLHDIRALATRNY